jgi:hypothetical protein
VVEEDAVHKQVKVVMEEHGGLKVEKEEIPVEMEVKEEIQVMHYYSQVV